MFIIFILSLITWWLWKSYNKIVTVSEQCNSSFSNIDTELARRFDLYLRATEELEDGSEFEKQIYTKITQLRIRQDISNSEKVDTVNHLLAVAESNPDVKSVGLFSNMQLAIDSTETRVQEARQAYNTDVKNYNVLISQLPMNIAAGILKFKPRDYFQHKS